MKGQRIVQCAAVLAVIGLVTVAWVSTGQQARAGNPVVTAAVSSSPVVYAGEDEAKFIGSKKCKMCHSKVYKAWEKTTHSTGFDKLKPGEAKEAKEKAKLDPNKDYTKEKECLGCHTTGLGKPGGYEIKEDPKEMEKMNKTLGHTGCEMCHGPGEKYIAFHKKIKKEKLEYTPEDMKKAGTITPGEEQCKQCHNEKSPTWPGEFKFEEAVKKGIHKVEKE